MTRPALGIVQLSENQAGRLAIQSVSADARQPGFHSQSSPILSLSLPLSICLSYHLTLLLISPTLLFICHLSLSPTLSPNHPHPPLGFLPSLTLTPQSLERAEVCRLATHFREVPLLKKHGSHARQRTREEAPKFNEQRNCCLINRSLPEKKKNVLLWK